MELSNYQIDNLILNTFDTYIVYKYMGIMFNKAGVNRKIELLSYSVYFIYSAFFFLFLNVPVVLMISNIIAYVVLTFNYKVSMKKRLFSAILIYVIQVCIELGVTVIYFGYNPVSTYTVNNIPAPLSFYIIIRIVIYIPCLIVSKYLKYRDDINLPTSLWFSIFLIPLISLLSYVFILGTHLIKEPWVLIASAIVLLTLNFSVNYLYTIISATFAEKYNHILISKQNEYYNNQFELMKNSIKVRNAEKHDLKNHLSAIDTLLHMNESGKAIEHISTMMDLCEATREYSSSGNVVIDSILNYKIQEAEQNGIAVNVELSIPEYLGITSFDMTVILGNILDNAMNATKELEKDRIIDLIIKYNKGRLLIKIDNPFNGEVNYENNRLVTLHKDKDKHGIGLNNVLTTLEKYSGSMEIEYLNNIFSVVLLMFV